MKHRGLKIGLTIAIAVGGVVFIASQSLGDVNLFADVSQVQDDPEKYLGRKSIGVRGYVVAGSIEQKIIKHKQHRSFLLAYNGQDLAVTHTGPVADTFKDGAETVARGLLVRQGDGLVLRAHNGDDGIMAKCPSKYDGSR